MCIRDSHQAGGIQGADEVRLGLHPIFRVGGAVGLGDLVAEGPAVDAGVVPVPTDGGLDVPLPPVLEPQVVVVAVLANAPAVEELVDDVDAQLVAGVQLRLGGRVVGGADGIVAAFPQLLDFAELRPGQRGRCLLYTSPPSGCRRARCTGG